jgi:hypothetical protein
MQIGNPIFFFVFYYQYFTAFYYYRFEVDMSLFPTIDRINHTLSQLEVFQKAHPNAQPDEKNL